MDRVIRAEQIDFSDAASTPVVSESLRFILPVPALEGGGEPLRQPDGSRFFHRDGREMRGRGIVFFDRDDQCWETARGNGKDVIIFSPIDPAKAAALAARIGAEPERLTLDELKAIIDFAYDALHVRSAHNAPRAYVAQAMGPTDQADAGRQYGLYRRKAGDVCRAVYVPGAGAFVGAGATPQRFKDGAVILRHGDSVRLVQPGSFEETYRFVDGRPARIADLASQTP